MSKMPGQLKICKKEEELVRIAKISPIKAGPIKRSSFVLKPFSPVPTNAIIKPIDAVPKPM